MPFFDKAVETWKINQNNSKLKDIIYYCSKNFFDKKKNLVYLCISINIKCRITPFFLVGYDFSPTSCALSIPETWRDSSYHILKIYPMGDVQRK